MNLLNLHTAGVSNAARHHRHLERGCMPLWETDGNRSHDTLSREISHRNAARTIRGGDFSTLWRLCIESPSQPKLASSLHSTPPHRNPPPAPGGRSILRTFSHHAEPFEPFLPIMYNKAIIAKVLV